MREVEWKGEFKEQKEEGNIFQQLNKILLTIF